MMMNAAKRSLLAATALIGAAMAVPADAATFMFSFSGAPLGGKATATGSFDIADSALATINGGGMVAYGSVSNLAMTVSGATTGNGSFSTNSFSTFFFQTPSALDFSRELVGQTLSNGRTFGQAGQYGLAGDFNFFGNGVTSPFAFTPFTLATTRSGERMILTSLISATAGPEPASWAMMIAGVGAIGLALRRRAKIRTTVTYA